MKAITLEDILMTISSDWQILVSGMLAVTLIGCLITHALKRVNQTAANRFISVPFYITVVPGVFFTLVLLYLLFFTSKNLLTVPAFYYFPTGNMIVSLFIFSKIINFKNIPGFDRLSGFLLFLTVTFSVVLLVFKLRIIAIAWFSPAFVLGAVFLLYLLWKIGLKKFLGNK